MVAGPPKVKLMVFCCRVVLACLFFVAKILAGGQADKRGPSGLTEVQKKQSYKSFFTVTASDSHFKRYTRRFAAGCAGETFSARSGLFGGGSGLLFITLLSGRSGLSPLLGAPAGRGKRKIWGCPAYCSHKPIHPEPPTFPVLIDRQETRIYFTPLGNG